MLLLGVPARLLWIARKRLVGSHAVGA